uniref:Mitochondrial thiamine pyrophosphate carrier n=1 Tax=Biomphalaria glabrata TaxID=6526 RepID=A0A2C9JYL7_BIOGL
MVGFDPLVKNHLSSTDFAIAGAISGAVTRAVSQPLDVIKIRFQLQVEPIKRNEHSKYSSIYQAVRCIIKEEGLSALWKGHIPAQALSVFYGIAQYSCFEVMTVEIWQYLPEMMTTTYRPLTHTVCGGLSGCIASFIVFPLDIIRTRFVAQGEPKLYNSLTSAVVSIGRKEGPRGFYKGLSPTVIQIAPQMGFQFGLYSLFTGLWNKAHGIWPTAAPESLEALVCGSGSGALAKLIVYPLDVIKKRLQVQGFEKARRPFGAVHQYKGLFHCLASSVRQEGVLCLYKGLCPSLLKAGFVAGLNFCIYENVCKVLAYSHRTSSR